MDIMHGLLVRIRLFRTSAASVPHNIVNVDQRIDPESDGARFLIRMSKDQSP
jgi:hypothetical protein